MTINTRRLRRTAAGLLAGLVASGIVAISPAGSASALPAGSPPSGGISIIGSSLNSGSTWGLQFDQANSYCNGDGTAGYRWHTFIVPVATDPATLTFAGTGSPVSPTGGYVQPLRNTAGTPIRAQAPTTVNGSEGFINLPANLTFSNGAYGSTFAGSPASGGEFWIGVACTAESVAGENVEYWATKITATPQAGAGANNFVFAEGATPAAPVLTTAAAGDGQITATFTHGASEPATTGYTVTATPQGGGSAVTAAGAASPITVTGLTNGTTYDVTVTATNSIGNSVPSNTIAATPSLSGYDSTVGNALNATPDIGAVNLSWTPLTSPAPTGYELTVSSSDPTATLPTPNPIILGAVSSYAVTGLDAGKPYSFSLLADYTDPNPVTPATAGPVVPLTNAVVDQEITVTRPQGALILTQRCGVYGGLPAFTQTVNTFPGFPRDLAAVGTIGTTVGLPGTAPFLGWDDATNSGTGGTDSAQFPDYPEPANPARTHCGVSMTAPKLVRASDDTALAGRYFTADGALNQVTVLNTLDYDQGWAVTGTMENFVRVGTPSGGVNSSNSFDGDYLGWVAVKTDDSDPSGGYDQNVTAGPTTAAADDVVLPGSGVDSGTGLGSGKVLASAPAAAGLGEATLDARLLVLVPTSVRSGQYAGTLTLTAVATPAP